MKRISIFKRSLSFILCLVMLIVMAPMIELFPVASAVDHVEPSGSGTCGASHTGMTALTDTVMESYKVTFNGTTHYELPAGKYYLGEDIALLYPLWIAGADTEIHLDLRGHTFRSRATATYRAYNRIYSSTTQLSGMVIMSSSAILNLCDSVGGGGIDGSDLSLSGINGLLGCYNSAVIHMYGGTVYGNSKGVNGGGVHVTYQGKFYMYGGSISGNTANIGGGVFVGSSTSEFVMHGGIIANNTAAQGGGIGDKDATTDELSVVTIKGGTISGNRAKGTEELAAEGGGIYMSNGTLTIEGGTVSDNTAYGSTFAGGITGGGGGVCQDAGALTVTGGTIFSNKAMGTVNTAAVPSGGGGILVKGSKFVMSGGNLSDNEAAAFGGGVRKQSNEVIISGGRICNNRASSGGGIWANGNVTKGVALTVSGGRIMGNTATGNSGGGIGSAGGTKIVITGGTFSENLAGNVRNSVSVGNNGSLTIQGSAVVNDPFTFKTAGAMATIEKLTYGARIFADQQQNTDTTATITEQEDGYLYTCGHLWTDLTESTVSTLESGAYKLTDHTTTLAHSLTLSGQVVLDLAGKTLTGTTAPFFTVPAGATLIITDSVGGGKIIGFEANDVMIRVSGGSLVLESGSLTGHNHVNGGNGSVVSISDGSFIMNGGSITGNSSAKFGVVYVSGGSFVMNHGEFTSNKALRGGAITINGRDAVLEINGGKIGKENGGNVATDYGGGIYVIRGKRVAMNGGEICYNEATNVRGGGIYFNDTFIMNGGLIAYNTAKEGGALFSVATSFVMTGGEIRDNTSTNTTGYTYGAVMAGSGDTPGHADISGDSVIDKGAILSTGRLSIHDLKQGATIYTTKAATGVDGSVKTESTVAPYLYTWKLNTSSGVAEGDWIFFRDDFEDYPTGDNAFYTANTSSFWYKEFRNTEDKQKYNIVTGADGNRYLQLWREAAASAGDEHFHYFEYHNLSGAYTMSFDFYMETDTAGWVLNMLQDYTFPNGKPILAYVDQFGARICDQATDGTNLFAYIKNDDGSNFIPRVGTWYRLKMALEENVMTLKIWERGESEPDMGAGVAVCTATVIDKTALQSKHTIRFRTRIEKGAEASLRLDNLKLSKRFVAKTSEYTYAKPGDLLSTVTPEYIGQNLSAELPYPVAYVDGNNKDIVESGVAKSNGYTQLNVSLRDVRGNDTGIFYTTTLIVGDAYGIAIDGGDITVAESAVKTTKQLAVTVDSTLTFPDGYKIKWESEDPYVATVSSTGLLTYQAFGDTVITARVVDADGKDTLYFAKIMVQIGERPVRILSIGNDISSNAMTYLSYLAQMYGLRYRTDYLESGSTTIRNHAHNMAKGNAVYTWTTSNAATGTLRTKSDGATMEAAVESTDWDYIILNQAPIEAGFGGTYNEDIQYLLDYFADVQPGAKVYWNMNWAFINGSSGTNGSFSNSEVSHDENYAKFYNSNYGIMHNAFVSNLDEYIVGADARFGSSNPHGFDGWLPVGEVVNRVRGSVGVFTHTSSDFYSLNDIGRVAAGLAILKTLNPDLNLNTVTAAHISAVATMEDAKLSTICNAVTAGATLANTVDKVPAKLNVPKTDTSDIASSYPGSVILGQEDLPMILHFPDTKVTSDGTVWACAYVNTVHYPDPQSKNPENPMWQGVGDLIVWTGTQDDTTAQWQESYENPDLVISQELLEKWGCTEISGRYDLLKTSPDAGYTVMADPRDGNFGVVTTDMDGDGHREEVVLFTFWIRYYDQDGAQCPHRQFMTWATKEGDQWVWADRCQELKPANSRGGIGKRGDITAFSDGAILIPCYGSSVGVPVGATYDATSSFAMYMKFDTAKGEWIEIYSYDIPNLDRDEDASINEVSLVAPDPDSDTVYAFAREAGTVLVSYDRGQFWSKLANEDGICQQPGFTVLDKDRVFVTWSMSPIPRKTYGKVFYIHEGWEQSETQLIYSSPVTAYHDAADPSCALLPNGKVLIVSYDTPYQAIVGVFEDPNDTKYMAKELSITNEAWKLGHTLNLASDISVSLAIPKSALTGFDMDTVYVESVIDIYEGNTRIGEKSILLEPVEKGNYYYFTVTGLTAVEMNNSIISVLHGTKGGQRYESPVDTYSVASYAYGQLGKAATPQKLKALCAELLRYGAKAQIFKSYRLDALVDAKMTEEQKALLSDMEAVTFGNTNLTENIPATNSITWLGKSLDLASKVSVKFIFSLGSYTGSTEDLTMKVTYKDVNGKDKERIITDLEVYNASRGYYAFTLDSLLAAELRSVLTVQILSGDTVVSGTVHYAADTYGNGKSGSLGDLCKALFAYSDSAKAYFA